MKLHGEARNTASNDIAAKMPEIDPVAQLINLALSAKQQTFLLISKLCAIVNKLDKYVHENYHTSTHMHIAFPSTEDRTIHFKCIII